MYVVSNETTSWNALQYVYHRSSFIVFDHLKMAEKQKYLWWSFDDLGALIFLYNLL